MKTSYFEEVDFGKIIFLDMMISYFEYSNCDGSISTQNRKNYTTELVEKWRLAWHLSVIIPTTAR